MSSPTHSDLLAHPVTGHLVVHLAATGPPMRPLCHCVAFPLLVLALPAGASLRAAAPTARGVLATRGPAVLGCPVCGAPKKCGATPSALAELSGIAGSSTRKGIFYSITDSPHEPSVLAIRKTGEVVQTINLTGLASVHFGKYGWGDWESIAVGPCAPGSPSSCVFVADIGQNCARPEAHCDHTRDIQSIVRFEEPQLDSPPQLEVQAERLWYTYPKGHGLRHDAEAFLVTPSGDLLVITKEQGTESLVFNITGSGPSTNVTAKLLASVKKPPGSKLYTAADVRLENGVLTGITLLTYNHVVHIPLRPGQPLAALQTAEMCPMPAPRRLLQQEALAWEGVIGKSYLVASEGVGSDIWEVACQT